MSLNIVNHDNETINFDMEDVDTSFVNALRRLVLSDYETIGFNTDEYLNSDLKIIDNTSSLHNEFILHRFGLVPINIEDVNTFYNSKYTFSLQKENTTTEMISVTTEDFKVINTETNEEEPSINFFPPNKNTGEYILLLKLKSNPNNKGEKINIEGWWIPSTENNKVIIWSHGLRSEKSGGDKLELIKNINRLGYSVLTIDLRSHGDSTDGKFGFGIIEKNDIKGAINFLFKEKGITEVGLSGVSYGAVTSIAASIDSSNLALAVFLTSSKPAFTS